MPLTPLLVIEGLEKLHKNLIVKVRVEYTAWAQTFVLKEVHACVLFLWVFFGGGVLSYF